MARRNPRGDDTLRAIERRARKGDADAFNALRLEQDRRGVVWTLGTKYDADLLLADISALADSYMGSQGRGLDQAYLHILAPVIRDAGADPAARAAEVWREEVDPAHGASGVGAPFMWSERDVHRYMGIPDLVEQVENASLAQLASYAWHRRNVIEQEVGEPDPPLPPPA